MCCNTVASYRFCGNIVIVLSFLATIYVHNSKLSWSNNFAIFVNYTKIIDICVIKGSYSTLKYRALQFQNHKRWWITKISLKHEKFWPVKVWSCTVITWHQSAANTCSSALVFAQRQIYLAISKYSLLLLLLIWQLWAESIISISWLHMIVNNYYSLVCYSHV